MHQLSTVHILPSHYSQEKNVIRPIETATGKNKNDIQAGTCVGGIVCFGCHVEQSKLRWLISGQHKCSIVHMRKY